MQRSKPNFHVILGRRDLNQPVKLQFNLNLKSRLRILFLMTYLTSAFYFVSGDSLAWGSENLGSLEIDEISVRSEVDAIEADKTDFNIDKSYISFEWKKGGDLSAHFLLGKKSLVNQSGRFDSTFSNKDLGFVEAYAQLEGLYGRLRFGMLPIDYGVEGSQRESELVLSRTFLYSEKILALRDLGISYKISDRFYYTEIQIHNGESDSNTDGRVFLTSLWGIENPRHYNLGVSAQTGTTKPISTSSSGDTLAGVDVNEINRWRFGTIFGNFFSQQFQFMTQATFGERETQSEVTKFNLWNFDIQYDFTSQWGFLLRYESFDPNNSLTGDRKDKAHAALILRDKNATSNLYFIYTKNLEEGHEINNDEYGITWQVTPRIP